MVTLEHLNSVVNGLFVFSAILGCYPFRSYRGFCNLFNSTGKQG